MPLPAILIVAALQVPGDSARIRGATGSRLGITIGVAHLAQNVPTISPNRYAGPGIGVGVSYRVTGPRFVTEVRAGGTYARLHSANDTAQGPRDVIGLVTVSVAHLKRVEPFSSARVTTLLGARLDATGNFDSHSYGPYFPTVTDGFDYVAFTVGPASMIMIPLGRGEITQELSVPVAGAADFPWANGSAQRSLRLHTVTVPDLLAFDERLSWRMRAGPGWQLTWSYHLSYLRYAGLDTRRYARQGLSATLSTAIGGRR